MDYISILDGRIPTYYEAAECENNNMIFSYWYFYGYKDDCPMLPGDPGDDVNWGRYVVKVIGFLNIASLNEFSKFGWVI